MDSAEVARIIAFGPFELDVRSGELRKGGLRLALQDQPFRVLAALLERRGEIVARDDLRGRLWPEGTFVDYEHSLNAAIRRLRAVLGDDAGSPPFVETVPRRGYRFVAPARERSNAIDRASVLGEAVARYEAERLRVAVMPFANFGNDLHRDFFVDGLTDETTTQLVRQVSAIVAVIAGASVRHLDRTGKSVSEIGRALGVDYVLEGSVRKTATRVRISVQLIDAADQTHLWADVYDRELGNSLALQSEVARLITDGVKASLVAEEDFPKQPQGGIAKDRGWV